MMAITAAEAESREGPGLETGCTANLTTTARNNTAPRGLHARRVVPLGRADHDNPTGRDVRRPFLPAGGVAGVRGINHFSGIRSGALARARRRAAVSRRARERRSGAGGET